MQHAFTAYFWLENFSDFGWQKVKSLLQGGDYAEYG